MAIQSLFVSFIKGEQPIPAGRLAFRRGRAFFEFESSFLQQGLEISPLKLPLAPGVIECNEHLFDGLFGVFADSLPDGWGRLLLDRKLSSLGVNAETLTPLDRLAYVGSGGMGALRYEPEIFTTEIAEKVRDLDIIAEECRIVLKGDEETVVDHLLALNGSSAGARPKILVSIDSKKGPYTPSTGEPKGHGNDWIIKFSSSQDPSDIGPIEYAYHLMAQSAGVEVPEARLFRSSENFGYFGVKRFDRNEKGFVHMHTASGLLHADYRYPSLTYETLLKATFWLTRSVLELEKRYRQAVFNVFAHNRDDHAKNFSFLMTSDGFWSTSPAYDLTFSSGPAGEHSTTVMGEGRHPTEAHLLKLAESVGLELAKAREIIEQTKHAVSMWPLFAENAGVSQSSAKRIYQVLK